MENSLRLGVAARFLQLLRFHYQLRIYESLNNETETQSIKHGERKSQLAVFPKRSRLAGIAYAGAQVPPAAGPNPRHISSNYPPPRSGTVSASTSRRKKKNFHRIANLIHHSLHTEPAKYITPKLFSYTPSRSEN